MAIGTVEPSLPLSHALRSSAMSASNAATEIDWLRKLARISPVGIYRCDAAGRCVYVNERWCELTGRDFEFARGSGWERVIHPEDVPRVREAWGELLNGAPFKCEYRYIRPDGSVLWVYGEVTRDFDIDGELLGYIGTAMDVVELHDTREQLLAAQRDLEGRVAARTQQLREVAMVVEQSDDAIMRFDLDGRITGWNNGATKLFGYTAAEMLGQSAAIITPREESAASLDMLTRVRAGETVTHQEVVRVCKSGELIELAVSAFPLRDEGGTIIGTSGLARNITERKKAERRMQQLTRRLVQAHEEERRRIARELHDSTAQVLAALTMNLSAMSRPVNPETNRQLLSDSIALALQAVKELRTQSFLLHPPLLEEKGLAVAARCFVEGFTDRSGIAVELDLPTDLARLPEACEAALFRVLQESLANVHRHSECDRAKITLRTAGSRVELTVRDFGRGCAPQAGKPAGVGVAGMRERLDQLGGTFSIEPAKPGTRIVATLPLD